ncbi:MAG: N-acetylmuramoyl-L-alanine amidase [Alphaproteobacteria bacterium]|nr:N-acetylmuramoyl-L-alanine amidase [Alphaproteobacteria bacterium]
MELFAFLLAALLSFVPPFVLPRGGKADGVTIPLDSARNDPNFKLPPVSEARRPNSPLVVIDAGHGGRDPGAISPLGGQREKYVTLALARALRDGLIASGRVRVALTRNDDSFLELRDRYEIARRLKADLFISIHADAAPNPDASGATIYTLSEVASDREAALLAARENKVDIIGGVGPAAKDADVNRILIDLAQRESMSVSADFTRALYREAAPFIPFRPVYHRFASFVVLKAPDVPSILFEAGYITHPRDVAYIHSREGQRQIATGLRRAIEAHFARRMSDVRSARPGTS